MLGKAIFSPHWTLNLDTEIEFIGITDNFYVVSSKLQSRCRRKPDFQKISISLE